jgi:Flp pilus assembly protein TadD
LNSIDNAFADFNQALKLNPKLAESWSNQALIYEIRGENSKATKSYQRAVILDPGYGPAQAGLSRVRGVPDQAPQTAAAPPAAPTAPPPLQ